MQNFVYIKLLYFCRITYQELVIFAILSLIQAVQVVFDGTTKRVKSITNKLSKISVNVDQGFYWYNSSDGHNVNSSQASGAYVFRYILNEFIHFFNATTLESS